MVKKSARRTVDKPRPIALVRKTRPEVVQLLHPAFDGSPGHAHWRALCSQAAGLVSVRP